jgi:hypothetical protein
MRVQRGASFGMTAPRLAFNQIDQEPKREASRSTWGFSSCFFLRVLRALRVRPIFSCIQDQHAGFAISTTQ